MLRGKSEAEKIQLAERVIAAYCEGKTLFQQAEQLGTSKRSLERLLLTYRPIGWFDAQLAALWVRIEDIHDDTGPIGWHERKRIAFRMDRIEGHKARHLQRLSQAGNAVEPLSPLSPRSPGRT